MDSLKSFTTNGPSGGGDIYAAWIGFLWNNYLSNPGFWAIILLVLFFMLLARIFIFDNKNLKINSKSWSYPGIFLVICIFCVWLKNDAPFEFTKKYIADLCSTIAVVFILYTAFGHKLLQKVSAWAGGRLGLNNPAGPLA